MNDAEQLQRLYALLDRALDLPVAERADWLGSLTGADQTLVPRLRELLRHDGVETDDFMKRSAAARLPPLDGPDTEDDHPGSRVGPFRLLAKLGRGGMASVWLAERDDGTLVRQVALKLPSIGWSPGLLKRMARERELLAALEHPHIARLYDAGLTPEGRPWLAMELVHGKPIDAWCRDHGADLPTILRLALQVCEALSHAHARLIVHRDLKPANILVTAEGQVRLVDFGVGKLLHDDAPGEAPLTQLHGNAFTPDYASPEQVARGSLTVATDVYSLGVVIYELITGARPYRPGRAGEAPEPPGLLNEAPLASARVADRKTLARQLKGDIDNILAKALSRDVAQRYATAESLASDLQRYLEGRPVLAQRRGRWYRVVKFVKRHRVPVFSGIGALLALCIGLGAALLQSRQARLNAETAWRNLELAEASYEFGEAVLVERIQAEESVRMEELRRRGVSLAARYFDVMPIARASDPLPLPRSSAPLAWPPAAAAAPEAWLTEKGTTALIVLRRGELVYEGYFGGFGPDSIGTSYSMAKSMVSALVGIALAEGRIPSLDEPVTRWLPELAQADARFAQVTLRHLLLMRSGIAFDEGSRTPLSDAARLYMSRDLLARVRGLGIGGEPDRQLAYSSADVQLLGLVLERATGMPLAHFAESRLWQPMGAEFDASWSLDSAESGIAKAFCCVNARARDFARFGQLFLRGGRVGNRQVIPEAWVRESTAVASRGGASDAQRRNIESPSGSRRAFYAYHWRRAAGADGEPTDDYYAQGLLGHYVYVAPGAEMVIVRLGRHQGDVFWPAILGELARLNR